MLNYFRFHNDIYLRLPVVNPNLDKSSIDKIITELVLTREKFFGHETTR